MKRITLLIGLVVLSLSSSQALSQTACGDANSSGVVTISDLIYTMQYLCDGPPMTISAAGDCDNRAGITIADAEALTRYIFFGESSLDCSIQATYGFAPAPNDTVFLPFMVAIPDNVDSVTLPVITSFAADTRAFYIPCQVYETNGPGLFEFISVARVDDLSIDMGIKVFPDTAIMEGTELGEGGAILGGRHTFFEIVLHRSQTGLAAINCGGVMRSANWRISVEKNGNLYVPVIQYYQVPLPHPVVTATPSPVVMEAKAGFWSTATYPVTFTSNMGIVSFDLAASDSWLVIDNPSPTGYTTPATINLRANASALAPGDYAGQITIADISPADAEFVPAVVDVTLAVTVPMTFPPSDINCDGNVSIGDISVLIDCLFINVRPIPVCE